MRELHGDIELSLEQATLIAQAMTAVAEADGVHEREQELIEGFYAACAGDTPLADGRYDGPRAAAIMSSPEAASALVKSCYLLALADGAVSPEEQARIAQIATDVGIDSAGIERCARDAKLYLMAQFKGVNVFKDSARAIGQKLGLDDDTLDQALS